MTARETAPPDDLLTAARSARANAYAPYSSFPVGAALRGAAGGIFAGANAENASYPVGTCAEAGAVAAMVASGERRIVEAVIIGGAAPLRPCGACRQRLAEFARASTPVFAVAADGAFVRYTMEALLPGAFGAADLGTPAPGLPKHL